MIAKYTTQEGTLNIEYKFHLFDLFVLTTIISGIISIFLKPALIAFFISLGLILLYDIKNITKIIFFRFKTYVLTFGKIIKMFYYKIKGQKVNGKITTDDKVMFSVIVAQIVWLVNDIINNNFGIWSIAIFMVLVVTFFLYNVLISVASNLYSLIYKILLSFKTVLGLKMYLKRLQKINKKLLELQKIQSNNY